MYFQVNVTFGHASCVFKGSIVEGSLEFCERYRKGEDGDGRALLYIGLGVALVCVGSERVGHIWKFDLELNV